MKGLTKEMSNRFVCNLGSRLTLLLGKLQERIAYLLHLLRDGIIKHKPRHCGVKQLDETFQTLLVLEGLCPELNPGQHAFQ